MSDVVNIPQGPVPVEGLALSWTVVVHGKTGFYLQPGIEEAHARMLYRHLIAEEQAVAVFLYGPGGLISHNAKQVMS